MNQETAQKILAKTKADYNQIAEEFSNTRVWLWKVMEFFFTYLKPGNKILDIGCGNGRLYELLKDKQIEYVGVDNSERLIEIAKEKLKTQNLNLKTITQNLKINFQVADALVLPFGNEEFNHVFMIAVLPHIPSMELQSKALANAHRVLKKDGYLFITCWNLWQPKMFWQNLKNRIKNPKLYRGLGRQDFMIPWKSSAGEILSQRFYHAFTKKELKKLLEKAGFKMERIYYEYKGKKATWFKGFNLIAIARKT